MEVTPWGFKSPLSQMNKKIATFFLLLSFPLWALKVDPNCRGFDNQKKTEQIDRYDFAGLFPKLEKINIDAHKRKYVELELTGEYPLLKSICFDGSFGRFDGNLTGSFPLLTDIDVKVTSNKVNLDLRGDWTQDCNIIITGTSADITLNLPKTVGLDIKTKTAPRGKVTSDWLKKKGLLNKKRFVANPDADVQLTLYVEVTDGQIKLE